MRHVLAAFVLLAACGSGGSDSPSASPALPPPAPPPPTTVSADITLLFFGNSHTSVNNVPGMVADMVRAARPGRTVGYYVSPAWMFLEERASDPSAQALLAGQDW